VRIEKSATTLVKTDAMTLSHAAPREESVQLARVAMSQAIEDIKTNKQKAKPHPTQRQIETLNPTPAQSVLVANAKSAIPRAHVVNVDLNVVSEVLAQMSLCRM